MAPSNRPMTRDAMKAVSRLMPSHGQRLRALSHGAANRSSSPLRPACFSACRFGFVAHDVHHRVDGQAADELAAIVDDRRRDEVVALERLDRVARVVVRAEA